jgi:hypothetical protein
MAAPSSVPLQPLHRVPTIVIGHESPRPFGASSSTYSVLPAAEEPDDAIGHRRNSSSSFSLVSQTETNGPVRDFSDSSLLLPRSETDAPLLNPQKPPYTAFSDGRRKFLLAIVTAAAFLAPVAGNIYLPALPQLAIDFHVSHVAINATVSIFMLVFAIAVRDCLLF